MKSESTMELMNLEDASKLISKLNTMYEGENIKVTIGSSRTTLHKLREKIEEMKNRVRPDEWKYTIIQIDGNCVLNEYRLMGADWLHLYTPDHVLRMEGLL